jgi:hypothetical protein
MHFVSVTYTTAKELIRDLCNDSYPYIRISPKSRHFTESRVSRSVNRWFGAASCNRPELVKTFDLFSGRHLRMLDTQPAASRG